MLICHPVTSRPLVFLAETSLGGRFGYFLFFSGWGRGWGVRGVGRVRGALVFNWNPRKGGGFSQERGVGGRDAGRVSAGNFGGGGLNMFFRGRNSRQEAVLSPWNVATTHLTAFILSLCHLQAPPSYGSGRYGFGVSGPRIPFSATGALWGRVTPFLDDFSKHLSSVLGRTELCHEVQNPAPQKPQIIRNPLNHHLALSLCHLPVTTHDPWNGGPLRNARSTVWLWKQGSAGSVFLFRFDSSTTLSIFWGYFSAITSQSNNISSTHPSRDAMFFGQKMSRKAPKIVTDMTSWNLQNKHFWHHVMW